MSKGKYRRLYTISKKCLNCGREFFSCHKNARFCSEKCYRKMHNPEQRKTYQREYARRNKTKRNAQHRESYQRHRKQKLEYSAKYYREHTKICHDTQKALKKRQRAKIIEMLGNVCFICHKEINGRTLHYHEIHGKWHRITNLSYTLRHLEDFIPLCAKCHNALTQFGCLSEEEQKRLLELSEQLLNRTN